MSNDKADTFKALDGNMLAGILGKAAESKKKREDAKGSSKGGDGKFAPMGYPQEGTSKIRIFLDPTGKLYRAVKAFQVSEPKFKRIMDPRFFLDRTTPDGTVIPEAVIEKVWNMTKNIGWQNNSKYQALAYVQVISADKTHDKYWKPGECYLMAHNGKFEDALLAQLQALMEGCAEDMAASVNPLADGWAWTMNVVKGSQGSVSLTPTVGVKSPALEALPEWFKPLDDQYVEAKYSEEDMNILFDNLQRIRDEKGLDSEETYGLTEEQLEEAKEKSLSPMEFAAELGNEQAIADLAAAKEESDKMPNVPEGAGKSEGKPEGKAEEKAEEKPAGDAPSEANNWGLAEAQLTAAKAMNKTPAEFAAEVMNVAEAKAFLEAQASGGEEEKSEEGDGEHNNWGLTDDQVSAANAANIPLKDFAEMCK
ncbi:hypothetical protein [Vibrio phage Va2]|nr:hypothetical protein [Vibrio phage Va2]